MPRRSRRATRRRRIILAVSLGVVAGALLTWWIYSRRQPGRWQHVFATREGMIGSVTSTQLIIRSDSMFVALPDPRALGRDVEVRYGNRSIVVPVLDVGPWNIADPYWETDARPASESGRGTYRRPVNPAGIDLSDPVFSALGLRDNDYVDWRFVHRGYVEMPWL